MRLTLLLTLLLPAAAQDPARLRPLPPVSRNAQTGPAVGARLPEFTAPDQHGVLRNFDNLRGPQGLVLVFLRSADW